MTIRKLPDIKKWAPKPCLHPQHLPPSHISLPAGNYEHTCPACKRTTQFHVDAPFMEWED